jgi:hypothetical protein
MKKIIMGKVYDTETAKEIGYYNDQPTGNLAEYLYQKKTGEFFIKRWDAWNGGSIQPITYTEAQDWLEKHGSAEQYAAVFGEPDEGSEDVTLGLRVSAAAAAKLKRKAAAEGMTQSAILERWIMNA